MKDIPTLMEEIIFIFIFCAQILGELECYYIQFPYWDTMLHTVSGFLFAAVGFSLIDIMADLFVNFIGALVFSISGGFYIKHRGEKKSITKNLIVKIKGDGE